VKTILLQSADKAREFAELDPDTGTLDFFSKERAERENHQASLSGLFASIEDIVVILARENDLLKLRLGDNQYVVTVETTSRLTRSLRHRFLRQVPGYSLQCSLNRVLRARNRFELIREGSSVVVFNYRITVPYMPFFDPTPFVEERAL